MAQSVEVYAQTSGAAVEAQFNAAWASRLNYRVLGCQLSVRDLGRFSQRLYLLIVTYDDAGSTMSAPYRLEVAAGSSPANLQTAIDALLTAAPASFWSEAIYAGTDPAGVLDTDLAALVTTTDATNGALNWRVSGRTSGSVAPAAAGGDLTGNYPDPQVIQITGSNQTSLNVGANSIESVATSAVGSVLWEVVLVKGIVRAYYTVAATDDGTTASVTTTQQVATAGTVDVTLTAVLSAGNLVLQATASTAGWTAGWRRTSLGEP